MSQSRIPTTVEQAYKRLEESGEAELVSSPTPEPKDRAGSIVFRCAVEVPAPNEENIPERVCLKVVIPPPFPFTAIQFFPEGDEVRGFPHQDAETGKLCLVEDRLIPQDETRLLEYIRSAKGWLRDAAQGALLSDGDSYELPDFSRRELKIPQEALLFDEDADSGKLWRSRIAQHGRVALLAARSVPGLCTTRFQASDGSEIRGQSISQEFVNPSKQINGQWVLLPDIRYFRHRPPQTFGELRTLCAQADVDLDQLLKRAWENENVPLEQAVLLVGFPVPLRVGDEPSEIHWQPLFFGTHKAQKKQHKSSRARRTRSGLWEVAKVSAFGTNTPLCWGKSRNVATSRFYARGHHSSVICSARIALCGCGAIGSCVGELLARGGALHLSFFDPDRFDLDNQCRHSLEGEDVGQNKAVSLASRLASTNPLSVIQGFPLRLPIPDPAPRAAEDGVTALNDTDTIIDCTTDDGAFYWLSGIARRSGKRMVSMFLDFGAELLTVCVSGKQTSCWKVAGCLYKSIKAHETPLDPAIYFRIPSKDEQIIPGAGCWHPTFPARLDHIWLLTGAAIDLLNQELVQDIGCDGVGLVIRRGGYSPADAKSRSLVEVVWRQRYR